MLAQFYNRKSVRWAQLLHQERDWR